VSFLDPLLSFGKAALQRKSHNNQIPVTIGRSGCVITLAVVIGLFFYNLFKQKEKP